MIWIFLGAKPPLQITKSVRTSLYDSLLADLLSLKIIYIPLLADVANDSNKDYSSHQKKSAA